MTIANILTFRADDGSKWMSNVAILVLGYRRPEMLEKKVNELLVQTSNIIYIAVDGVDPLSADVELVNQVKACKDFAYAMIEKHSNRIRVFTRVTNLGLFMNYHDAITQVLHRESAVIVLEDDVVFEKSFIAAMESGLSLLSDKILAVQGYSPFSKVPLLSFQNYWRISSYFNCWGWAINQENWARMQSELLLLPSPIFKVPHKYLSNRKIKTWNRRFQHVDRNQFLYRVQHYMFRNGLQTIVPRFRLSSNEGFGTPQASHTKHKSPLNLSLQVSDKVPDTESIRLARSSANFWRVIDSNLWAGDGILTVRGRHSGIRTRIRRCLKSLRFRKS